MQLAMISAKMMMPDMRSYFPCEQPDSISWLRQCRYARTRSATMSAGLLVTSGSSSAVVEAGRIIYRRTGRCN